MVSVFRYGKVETDYLMAKDKRLAEVIARIGHIERETDDDVFASVVHHIVGQQISAAAQRTVWQRMLGGLGEVSAEAILSTGAAEIQAFGVSMKKAEYITDFARKVASGEFDIQAVSAMSDADATAALVSLKGIGVWTAEMLLLFTLQRPDVLSFGDFAIQRGLRMVYHHRQISRERFEIYRRRYSPYGSVASLYLWAVAGGALPDMKDYAPPKTGRKGGGKK